MNLPLPQTDEDDDVDDIKKKAGEVQSSVGDRTPTQKKKKAAKEYRRYSSFDDLEDGGEAHNVIIGMAHKLLFDRSAPSSEDDNKPVKSNAPGEANQKILSQEKAIRSSSDSKDDQGSDSGQLINVLNSKLGSLISYAAESVKRLTTIQGILNTKQELSVKEQEPSNDNETVKHQATESANENLKQKKESGSGNGQSDRVVTQLKPTNSLQAIGLAYPGFGSGKPIASVNGESPTSEYRQNEKVEKDVTVSEFGEQALKQLHDALGGAGAGDKDDSEEEGSSKSGIGKKTIIGSLAAAAGGGLATLAKKVFGKPKIAPVEQAAAAEKEVGGLAKAAEGVAGEGKAVAAAEGGLAKAAPKLLGGLGKVGGALAKGAGIAAVPLAAGLDSFDRFKKGQTAKQNVIGTGAGVAGGLAGAWAGAEGGAAVGGGIGALFGGVGAVPGAAIGGAIGGVGGYLGGSALGGKIADKFTGVDQKETPKIQNAKLPPKEMGPSSAMKDLKSLSIQNAEIKIANAKQAGKQDQAPIVISAPSNTTVSNKGSDILALAGGSGRGSLDLDRF